MLQIPSKNLTTTSKHRIPFDEISPNSRYCTYHSKSTHKCQTQMLSVGLIWHKDFIQQCKFQTCVPTLITSIPNITHSTHVLKIGVSPPAHYQHMHKCNLENHLGLPWLHCLFLGLHPRTGSELPTNNLQFQLNKLLEGQIFLSTEFKPSKFIYKTLKTC